MANLISKYEIGLVKSSSTGNDEYKNEKHSENIKSEEEYDLEQIHDLGFTLSPKPFNLVLRKRQKKPCKSNMYNKSK